LRAGRAPDHRRRGGKVYTETHDSILVSVTNELQRSVTSAIFVLKAFVTERAAGLYRNTHVLLRSSYRRIETRRILEPDGPSAGRNFERPPGGGRSPLQQCFCSCTKKLDLAIANPIGKKPCAWNWESPSLHMPRVVAVAPVSIMASSEARVQ